MAKVVFKSQKRAAKSKSAVGSVTQKRVQGSNGRSTKILTIDGNSPTLGNDLLYVFKRNVAKARRENKKLVGAPDRVPTRR